MPDTRMVVYNRNVAVDESDRLGRFNHALPDQLFAPIRVFRRGQPAQSILLIIQLPCSHLGRGGQLKFEKSSQEGLASS